jgi:hypothetical protein
MRHILEIFFPGAKLENREQILGMFEGIGLRIEYESFYGQKFVLDRRNENKLKNSLLK